MTEEVVLRPIGVVRSPRTEATDDFWGGKVSTIELDAIDGTPVIDVKPWIDEFGPRGEVRQPEWMRVMLEYYFHE